MGRTQSRWESAIRPGVLCKAGRQRLRIDAKHLVDCLPQRLCHARPRQRSQYLNNRLDAHKFIAFTPPVCGIKCAVGSFQACTCNCLAAHEAVPSALLKSCQQQNRTRQLPALDIKSARIKNICVVLRAHICHACSARAAVLKPHGDGKPSALYLDLIQQVVCGWEGGRQLGPARLLCGWQALRRYPVNLVRHAQAQLVCYPSQPAIQHLPPHAQQGQ